MLHIKLVYLEDELGNSWRNDFSECENISIIKGDITKIKSQMKSTWDNLGKE